MNGDIEQKLQKVEYWMQDRMKGVKTIMGGDFNARPSRKWRDSGKR